MRESDKVEKCVEELCARGCNSVRSALSAGEKGQRPRHLEGLTKSELSAVLEELQAIMDVYDRR